MATIGPRMIQVLEFASARAPELQALHELAHREQMHTAADAKLGSQRNQRRRRANAFKSHRMPQRLRQKAGKQQLQEEELISLELGGSAKHQEQQQDSLDAKAPKQRSRKHERRPHTLAENRSWQNRNSSNGAGNKEDGRVENQDAKPVWMATHLWHSKRMKMVEKYGMMLPAHRADKSVSASLDALRSKATLHDMSYYGILEMYGLPQLILEALQLVSDPAGSDFHGMRFLSGGEEGQSILYHEGQFPVGAICPVTFMWRPLQADARSQHAEDTKFQLHADWQETKRQLWLWIHPAAYMEAASAIAAACQAVVDGDDDIQILDRRGHLCRFKVRGKIADELLSQVCGTDDKTSIAATAFEDGGSDREDGFAASYVAEQCGRSNLTFLRKQLSRHVKKSEQRSGSGMMIHSVVVTDPRARNRHGRSSVQQGLPAYSLLREPTQAELGSHVDDIVCPISEESLTSQKGGIHAEEPESELLLKKLSEILQWTSTCALAPASSKGYPFTSPLGKQGENDEDTDMATAGESAESIPCSYLWSHSKRQLLSKTFLKDHEVNDSHYQARQARVQQIAQRATGTNVVAEGKVQTSGDLHLLAVKKEEPFPTASGWDLIVLPCFAATLLRTLVFAGALVVGLDEDEALDAVLHKPSFPRDFPDTHAGERYWKENADALEVEYLKKPKAKRFSYEKHRVASPFQPSWGQLFTKDHATATGAGSASVEGEEENGDECSPCVLRGEEYMEPFCFYSKRADRANDQESSEMIPVAVPTLVRVVLRVPGRASLVPNAMMYMPTSEDAKSFWTQKNWNGCEVQDHASPERSLVGFVTSAVYDRPKGAFRATGFCACEPLQEVFLQQQEHMKSRDALVMLRTPHAKLYRPVLIRAEP